MVLPRHLPLLAVFLLAVLPSCLHAPSTIPGAARISSSGEGTIVVRVSFREEPVAGARVAWARSVEDGPPALANSGVTDSDGRVALKMPPGKSFFVAAWRADGDFSRGIAAGDRFAWFGGNPVYVQPGTSRELFLGLEEFALPPDPASMDVGGTGVAGVVLAEGVPVPSVHVSAYLTPAGGFRDIGFAASSPTAPDGTFVLDLPPGKYYLVARRRSEGGAVGPLRKGDLFGYYAANPVVVATGNVSMMTIPATLLRLRNTPSYSDESNAAAFVEGRIVDVHGRPVRGAYAALYENPELLNRPRFLSDRTGEDGRYRLPVPTPGIYYLGARTGYGGAPVQGDLYGRYEGTPDHRLAVRQGDRLTGVDLVVEEVR